MDREPFLEVLGLKEVDRAGWKRSGLTDVESVAGHSWGVAFLAMQICPPELDRLKVIEMAVCHDVAEVRVGDITPHDGISAEEKIRIETEAMLSLSKGFPRGDHMLEPTVSMKSERQPRHVFSNSATNLTWLSNLMFTNHVLRVIFATSERLPIALLSNMVTLIC